MVNNVYSIEVSINPKCQIVLYLESSTLPSIDPLRQSLSKAVLAIPIPKSKGFALSFVLTYITILGHKHNKSRIDYQSKWLVSGKLLFLLGKTWHFQGLQLKEN